MEAIILAGGFGTRLRQVVPALPKPMAPVAGRPFLEILLQSLAEKGFDRIVLSLGYLAEKVIDHFGNRFSGIELIYEIERAPLGTGGAILQAMSRCNQDHVFVFNGDSFVDLEVSDVEECWMSNRVPIIAACEVQNTARYGRIDIDKGWVRGFREKGKEGPGLINAGCYLLPVDILNDYSPGTSFSFEKDFLMDAIKNRRFDVFVTRGIFVDIGEPEDYFRAQELFI